MKNFGSVKEEKMKYYFTHRKTYEFLCEKKKKQTTKNQVENWGMRDIQE